ncbi:TonB-dependent receptor SusC [termite gut metagenome]|uniref:TonB-dependent receptor SusC n=1 Tax=termite gut metagenome TaxID=433724 RepID=A0A5J4RFQ4_9ZZZZ
MVKLLQFFRKYTYCLGKISVVLFAVIFSFPALAQQRGARIEGRVIDEKTQESIIGASVSLVSERTGAVTDLNGRFTINARSLPVTISVKYIGYKQSEIEVYEYTEPLLIAIRENANVLNEVVVVGYGTQNQKELTGAVSSVSPIALSQQTLSFDKALGGAVAGLNVTQSSGQPGATSTIRIRGNNSIAGSNEPLYVVDGFILYNDNSSTRTGMGGTTSGVGGGGSSSGAFDGGLNPLTSINSSDIESIDVLKDVSATAIYGSRGANGVIIITTKKGKRGRSNVDYQGSVGVQQISRTLNLLNASEWADLNKEISNDNKSPYDPSQPYDVSKLLPQGQSSDCKKLCCTRLIPKTTKFQ